MKRSNSRLVAAYCLAIALLFSSEPKKAAFGDDVRSSAPTIRETNANGENVKKNENGANIKNAENVENAANKKDDSPELLQAEPVLSIEVRTNETRRPTSTRRRVVLRADASQARKTDAAAENVDSTEEKNVDSRTFFGREIADYRTENGGGTFVLEDDLGELRVFENAKIESIETTPEVDAKELREQAAARLLQEFGDGFQTKLTERYLFVYNVSEGYAEWCARLFESLGDAFEKFAEKNDLELTNCVAPPIVVIFATRLEFNRYAAKETPDPSRVAAYYNMQTNRVVLCDLSGVENADEEPSRRRRSYLEVREFLSRPNAAFNVATIVHEATHQIAFNRGVFLRTGPFPLWAVEGLSLVFETPNGKTSQDGWGYRGAFSTNERQLASFRDFAARATGDPVRDLIRQDRFMNDLQGSYSTSWALFYYLYKKKPKQLSQYLQKIAAKPPYILYPPEERVADFEEFFGGDWEKLSQNLWRFVRSL